MPLCRRLPNVTHGSTLVMITHDRDLAGSGEYPRLAWQSDRYLYEQPKAFRDGERDSRDDLMKAPVAGLSNSELEAIAHYLATF